ncbi:hypothetical protein DSO57_1036415 [Entomophthora muscae]|uniref:Uncharacterized protein n=1 Tax=Entomophthora muscae TaxID=34485 RepID=A0ACC2SZK3_9FUNG|nr:hypothetical protein DSO57_1036415 [Entomophthora muscae]
MKEIPSTPPLPSVLSAQDFSKLGFVYITALGLANQVVPHAGSWRPLATAAQPASPVGVQLDSGMSHDSCLDLLFVNASLALPSLLWSFYLHISKGEYSLPLFTLKVLKEGVVYWINTKGVLKMFMPMSEKLLHTSIECVKL